MVLEIVVQLVVDVNWRLEVGVYRKIHVTIVPIRLIQLRAGYIVTDTVFVDLLV